MRALKEPESQRQKVGWWGPGSGGGGTGELEFNGDRVSVLQDEKVLETEGGDSCSTMECT